MRNAVAQQLTDQLYTNVNAALLAQALPPRLKPLAPTIAGAAELHVKRVVAAIPRAAAGVELWTAANRNAHSQLMNIPNGGEYVQHRQRDRHAQSHRSWEHR